MLWYMMMSLVSVKQKLFILVCCSSWALTDLSWAKTEPPAPSGSELNSREKERSATVTSSGDSFSVAEDRPEDTTSRHLALLSSGSWRCRTQSDVHETISNDRFSQDGTGQLESSATFTFDGGEKLEVKMTSTTKWRLKTGQLCQRLTSFKLSSESSTQAHKPVLSSIEQQAKSQIEKGTEACLQIEVLGTKSIKLTQVNSPKKTTECSLTGGAIP